MKIFQPTPIVYAPMPKTASNTLLKIVQEHIDCTIMKPKSGGGVGHFIINKDELSVAKRTFITRKTPLVYQHFLPTEKNRLALQEQLNVSQVPKVIVSIRDIFDVAVSCADHQRKSIGPWWINRHENDYLNEELMDEQSYIWNTLVCLKFFASWSIANDSGDWDVKFVQFDKIVNEPKRCISEIAGFYKINIKNSDFMGTSEIRENMNVGVSGRGSHLSKRHKDIIYRIAETYNNKIDFSMIGLS